MILMQNSYEIVSIGNSGLDVDYHITFRLNDKCNLSCEYCRWFDGDNYRNATQSIDNLFEFFKKMKFKKVLFYFHGGEPGIHPNILKILNHLRLKEQEYNIRTYIEFQTNMSYSLKKFKKIVKVADFISISYHYIELMKAKKHLQFVKNFCYLKINKIKIAKFDVMLENVSDEELQIFYKNILWFLSYKEIIDSEMIHGFCHYEKNPITKTKHIEFYNKHNKTEQQFKIDGKLYNTNDLFAQGLNCKGKKCDAGSKFIILNADGNVFNCGIEMTYYRMKCIPIKPITNVIENKNYQSILMAKYNLKTTCKYDYCGGDFYIQKY